MNNVEAVCQSASVFSVGPQMDSRDEVRFEPLHTIALSGVPAADSPARTVTTNADDWVRELLAHSRYCQNPLLVQAV